MTPSGAALHGAWAHSHEEDTDDSMVFRRATHEFPPSRGRTSIDLRPDGTYVKRSPGPVDVPVESSGSWSLTGDRLVLGSDGDRQDHTWQLLAVEDDRLVARR